MSVSVLPNIPSWRGKGESLTCSIPRYHRNTTLRNVGNYGPAASRHTQEDRFLLFNNVSETTSCSVLRKEGCDVPTDMDFLDTNTYFQYLDQQVLCHSHRSRLQLQLLHHRRRHKILMCGSISLSNQQKHNINYKKESCPFLHHEDIYGEYS